MTMAKLPTVRTKVRPPQIRKPAAAKYHVTARIGAVKPTALTKITRFVEAVDPIGTIGGKKPGSQEEWRFAKALTRLGYQYMFQYSIQGGRLAGGQVIDFMVATVPLPTPVFIQGSYWHSGTYGRSRLLNLAKTEAALGGQAYPPVEVWDYEIPTMEDAMRVIRQRLGM
jgi:hypothetical protein